jgi:hypothetical protein
MEVERYVSEKGRVKNINAISIRKKTHNIFDMIKGGGYKWIRKRNPC